MSCSGPLDVTVSERLQDFVIRAATKDPNGLAVNGPDESCTYAQLDHLSGQLAGALRKLGVGSGDRVGVLLPKGVRAIAAFQAALRVGAAYVPLDSDWSYRAGKNDR